MHSDLTLLFAMQRKALSVDKTDSQRSWGTDRGSARKRCLAELPVDPSVASQPSLLTR